jgi:hypothetical protein
MALDVLQLESNSSVSSGSGPESTSSSQTARLSLMRMANLQARKRRDILRRRGRASDRDMMLASVDPTKSNALEDHLVLDFAGALEAVQIRPLFGGEDAGFMAAE